MEPSLNIATTEAPQSALSSLNKHLLPMPAWAHFVFHWAVIHDYPLPRPLYDRVVQIRIARHKIARICPADAYNWLQLSEVSQFLARGQLSVRFFQRARECEIPDSMSPQEQRALTLQMLRQYISLFMWTGNLRKARDFLDQLFAKPEGGTLPDLLLRAAYEMHASQAVEEDNVMRSAELKASAIMDLEIAKSLEPRIIQTYLNSLRKDLAKTLSTLWKEQGVVLSSVMFNEIPELASVSVRVDLAGGFLSGSKSIVVNLPLLSKKLESLFIGKNLTVGRLEGGSSFLLVYKILRTSLHDHGIKLCRTGVFTERTRLKLIPGDAICSRSQSSILYAVGLHGIFGRALAQRFKKGICWGTAVTWLTRTMGGLGDKYFVSVDNAVRHKWDDGGVKTLFHNFFSYQVGTNLDLSNWHLRAGLNRCQDNVLLHDPKILTEYISLLSGKNIGIICICGAHAVSAVIHPSVNEYALFFDSNEEQGDIIVNSPKSLAKHILDAMIVEESVAIQVYVKP